MASVLTPDFNIAYSGTHFLQQMFYQPEERNWGFGIYNVHGNVKYEKTLYFPQSLRKIWRTYTTCGFSATGGVTTITDKQLVVSKIKSNLMILTVYVKLNQICWFPWHFLLVVSCISHLAPCDNFV